MGQIRDDIFMYLFNQCSVNVIQVRYLLIYTHSIQTENLQLSSIFGGDLKNGTRLCVNYFKRRDLYEKRLIFPILNRLKCFLIYKRVPVWSIFLKDTNEYVFARAAFGPNRPFHTKLSLGTVIPSH